MIVLRWMGALLLGLGGGVLAWLSLTGTFVSFSRYFIIVGDYFWLLFPPALACVLLGISWALATGQRVRLVAGTLCGIAALAYTLLPAGLTFVVVISVILSTGSFGGLALLSVVGMLAEFSIMVIIFTAVAGVLLWKQEVRWVPYLFVGVGLGWLVCVGVPGHLPGRVPADELLEICFVCLPYLPAVLGITLAFKFGMGRRSPEMGGRDPTGMSVGGEGGR